MVTDTSGTQKRTFGNTPSNFQEHNADTSGTAQWKIIREYSESQHHIGLLTSLT